MSAYRLDGYVIGALALIAGSAAGVEEKPGFRSGEAGLFVAMDHCAVVRNLGTDTVAEMRAADGTVLRHAGTWRGRAGHYLIVRPEAAVEVELQSLSGEQLDRSRVGVEACPEALPREAAEALAVALDRRLGGYFGRTIDAAAIDDAFAAAVTGFMDDGPPGWYADARFEQAEWLRSTGRLEQAAEALDEALAAYRDAGDERGRADSFRSLGLVAWRQGRPDAAEQWFLDALEIVERTGSAYAQAALFNNLGLVADESGRREHALEYFEAALGIFQGPVDLRREIPAEREPKPAGRGNHLPSALNTLNNLALLYLHAGQPDIAERYLRNYLAFEAHVPETLAVAQARFNLGTVLLQQGRLDEALLSLVAALEQFETAHAGRWHAEALVMLSSLYLQLNDRAGALAYAERAAGLEIDDRRARAHVSRRLGTVALEMKDFDDALRHLDETIALLGNSGPTRELWLARSDIARAELSLGRFEAARERQQAAIGALDDAGFTTAAARARSHLGEILLHQGRVDEAIAQLEQALEVQQASGDLLGEFETLERLGRVWQRRSADAAIEANERAIALVDTIQFGRLPALRRSGFRTDARAIHDRQLALLLETGQHGQAWRVAEQARIGDLGRLRRARRQSVETPARNRLLDRHAELMAQWQAASMSARGEPAAGDYRVHELRREIDRVETEMQELAIDPPEPLALEQVQATLAPRQLLLTFYLAEEAGWVWAIDSDRARVIEIAGADRLSGEISELLRQVRHPRNAVGGIGRLARLLRDRLLRPAIDPGRAVDEILIQPDGVLHALPFGMLWSATGEGVPVTVIRRVLSAPGNRLRQAAPSPRRLLVLADPGWNDAESGRAMYPESSLVQRLIRDSGLARLPGTRREAEAIAELGGAGVEVRLRTGSSATRSFVVSGGLADFRCCTSQPTAWSISSTRNCPRFCWPIRIRRARLFCVRTRSPASNLMPNWSCSAAAKPATAQYSLAMARSAWPGRS